jgi:myo-inositol-hexaphosphate 3-phosphohydrolase
MASTTFRKPARCRQLLVGLTALALALPLTSPHASAGTGVVRKVAPGQSLAAALKASAPGDTVELQNGSHAAQWLDAMVLSGVTLRGQSRTGVTVNGLVFRGVSGLTVRSMTVTNDASGTQSAVRVSDGSRNMSFEELTVAPRTLSAFDVWAKSSHISLRNSTLSGTGVTGTKATNGTSRGVRINGAPYDLASWPTDITIAANDISGFGSDLIQIAGGQRVAIEDNNLRDPQINDDHNDGVQTFGSNDLRIERNRFSAPGPNSPDQAIMVRHHPTSSKLRVSRTTIANNVVTTWRGTGINVASSDGTVLVNNTVGRTGNSTSPGSSLALSGTLSDLRNVNNIYHRIHVSGSPNRGDERHNCVRSGGTGPGLITTDPQFADTETLRLAPTSPCRDAGTTEGAPTHDITGRPRDARPDIGAYEVVAVAVTPPPSAPASAETVTLPAMADSHVGSASPDANYAASPTLEVDGQPKATSYLMFDLSPYAGRTVTGAALQLHVTSNGSTGKQDVKLSSDNSWTEGGVTYANRPSLGSTVLGSLGPTAPSSSHIVPLDPAGIDRAAGGRLTLGLDSTSSDGVDLTSRETPTPPQLVLKLAPMSVPAPAPSPTTPADTTPPTVSDVLPTPGATGVAASASVTATFSEDLSAQSVNATTVVLSENSGAVVSASVSYDSTSRAAVLRPASALRFGVGYTAVVKGGPAGVKDVAGNPLAADRQWSFTTAAAPTSGTQGLRTVTAAVETVALPNMSGDIADDPAIWVDESNPARSVVIGTNKANSGGGIAVYDLSGKLLQFRADGKFNNVDLRTGMSLGGRPTVVVTASNRTTNTLAFYRLNTNTRQLEPIGARSISTGFEPYGLCMYKSRTGAFYAFVTRNGTSGGGTTDQYELFDNAGKVDARKVRSLTVGSLSEGCVADDDFGHLYISEEAKGIWKYGAEPAAGSARSAIGTVGDGRLVADIEGLAIAYTPGGGGYVIASSQGDSTFAVYDRRSGAWMRSFKVDGAGTVDGVTLTDGLDVVTTPLGSAFPNGLLVVHDAVNTGSASSNYKLVDLGQVLTG